MSNGSGLFGNQGPDKPHLVTGKRGVAGEVNDLRQDVGKVLSGLAALTVDEFIDPAAADVDAIKTSVASSAAAVSYSGAALDGVVGGAEMVPPRNPTITTTSHANIDAVVVAVTGKVRNSAGKLVDQVGAITLTDGGGVTDAEDNGLVFSIIESYDVPAQSGAGGAMEFGFGDVLGLGKPLVSRAGAPAVMQEIEAGTPLAADALTGTFVDAATSAPNGTYAPATVPDAANDYAVYYEYDPSQDATG